MSSTTPPAGDAPLREMPGGSRPLPAYPSLEFERKRAKKLLREMRRSNPAAKLSDAQFAAAREYGFLSWPRLVEYFKTLERHEQSGKPPAWYPLEHFEQWAQGLLSQHSRKMAHAAVMFATFIPRFYGKKPIEVLELPVTIDDAHLVLARENRYPSWEAFLEYLQNSPESNDGWQRVDSPMSRASRALRSADLETLSQIVAAHPEILTPPKPREIGAMGDLMQSAIGMEVKSGGPEARRMTDWLVAQGADLQSSLNRALLYVAYGYHRGVEDRPTVAEYVDFLIQRGADPNWMPPNGLTLLEHALLRPHRNRDTVDSFLKYVTPRKAFWISAALGDTEGLRRYFDKSGKLTPETRKHRPDLTAAGPFSGPLLPDPDDLEIMFEAFYLAVMHERYDSMDVLLDHGLPVDYAPWGHTIMGHATNARDVTLVAYLLKRGAVQDIQGATAEQMDQWLYEGPPTDPKVVRIYELCGGKNAAEVIKRYETRTIPPPQMAPGLVKAIELAKEEAARLSQAEVQPDNLFFALFRDERHIPLPWLMSSGVNPEVLKRFLDHRLAPAAAPQSDVPFSAAATEVVEAARSSAKERQRGYFSTLGLLAALIRDDNSEAAQILVAAGADLAKLRAALVEH